MEHAVEYLPHVNALLNVVATILLVTGLLLIKAGHELAHKRMMLACFVVSVVFLACYLVYHAVEGSREFPRDVFLGVRLFYYVILVTHIVLAATVPILALVTIYLGLRDRRTAHRRIARWTFPIWLYVSVTGVVIYVMLYHLYTTAA